MRAQNFVNPKPIIAIIGGAGPDAAIDLQSKLSSAMKKKLYITSDQDHYRVITDNNSQIPNRDKALLSNGDNPLIFYINSAKKLEEIGGNILIIACNTAHAYFNDIQKATNMRMINMIDETAIFFQHYYPKIKKIGLLATYGTIQTKLYHNAFAKYQVQVITPDSINQDNVVKAIYGIKAGFISNVDSLNYFGQLHNIYSRVSTIKSNVNVSSPKNLLIDAIRYFQKENIEAVILGCTEIPLAFNSRKYIGSCILIDPTEILANTTIDYAMTYNR